MAFRERTSGEEKRRARAGLALLRGEARRKSSCYLWEEAGRAGRLSLNDLNRRGGMTRCGHRGSVKMAQMTAERIGSDRERRESVGFASALAGRAGLSPGRIRLSDGLIKPSRRRRRGPLRELVRVSDSPRLQGGIGGPEEGLIGR